MSRCEADCRSNLSGTTVNAPGLTGQQIVCHAKGGIRRPLSSRATKYKWFAGAFVHQHLERPYFT